MQPLAQVGLDPTLEGMADEALRNMLPHKACGATLQYYCMLVGSVSQGLSYAGSLSSSPSMRLTCSTAPLRYATPGPEKLMGPVMNESEALQVALGRGAQVGSHPNKVP